MEIEDFFFLRDAGLEDWSDALQPKLWLASPLPCPESQASHRPLEAAASRLHGNCSGFPAPPPRRPRTGSGLEPGYPGVSLRTPRLSFLARGESRGLVPVLGRGQKRPSRGCEDLGAIPPSAPGPPSVPPLRPRAPRRAAPRAVPPRPFPGPEGAGARRAGARGGAGTPDPAL
jgi:hypothetical protein